MEQLIKFFVFIFGFFTKLKEDLADGKISRSEAWGLVFSAATGIWNPIMNWTEIKEGLKLIASDPAAREELKTALKAEFDLPDEEMESRIEEGLDLLDKIYTYVRSWFPAEG